MATRVHRLPVYQRTRAAKEGRRLAFRWEEARDPHILAWLGTSRVMLLPWLHALFPPGAYHPKHKTLLQQRDIPPSWRSLDQRLTKLFHHDFVSREPTRFGPLYALGNKGADELSARGIPYWGMHRPSIDFTTELRKVAQSSQLRHYLINAGLRYCLESGMSHMPHVRLESWLYDKEFKDEVTFEERARGSGGEETLKEVTLPLEPDNVFQLHDGTRLFSFLHEADRSTHKHLSFGDKIKSIFHWWQQERHKELGWNGYRLLTTTISRDRRDNLCAVTQKIITEIAPGKSIPPIFLFACQDDYISNPPAIYTNIWRSAADDDFHTLLE